MSKHHKGNNSNNENKVSESAEAEAPAVEMTAAAEAQQAPASPPAVAVELANVPVDDGNTLAHLIPDLPAEMARTLRFTRRVEPSDFDAVMEKLPPEQQQAMFEMLSEMNPQKPGVHITDNRIRMNDIRIFHGTGEDSNRPKNIFAGGMYGSNGKVLSVETAEQAAMLKAPTEIVAAVLLIATTRTYFPPRDPNAEQATVKEGEATPSKAPICSSMDRLVGRKFGSCAACPHRPWKEPGKPGDECSDDVQLFLALRGFTGIYRMIVKGTSVKKGFQPIKNKINGWAKPWTQFFSFTTEEAVQQGTKNRYYILNSRVATDKDNPQGIAPTAEEADVFALLSRQLETEIYYPQLASIYRDSKTAQKPETGADMGSLIAGVSGGQAAPPPPVGGLQDYSGSSKNM